MIKFNHRGDFFTFVNLAAAVCPELIERDDWADRNECMKDNGIVIRHPDIDPETVVKWTRSSISADSLMTHMFALVTHASGYNAKYKLQPWFWHCLKRGGLMKGWGNKEYRFMGIPMFTALSLKFGLPLIPQPIAWARSPRCRGYRADQAAMYVLLDIMHRRKITERHKDFMRALSTKTLLTSPHKCSPLVIAMFDKTHNSHPKKFDIGDEDRKDWGSCPGPVYRELLKFIRELKVSYGT